MAYQDLEVACGKDIQSPCFRECAPSAELPPTVSGDLSRAVQEDLSKTEETHDWLRDSHPQHGSRTEPRRRSTDSILSARNLHTDRGSRLQGPSLLTAGAGWAVVDFAIAFCTGSLVILLHVGNRNHLITLAPSSSGGFHEYFFSGLVALLFAACVSALSRLFGLHGFRVSRTAPAELLLIVQSVSLAAFGLYGALHFWDVAAPVRHMLPVEILLTSAMMFLSRLLWRRHRDIRFQRDIAVRNILIAGADPVGREVRDYLASLRYSGYRFKGFVTLDEDSEDVSVAGENEIVGSIQNVISLARSMFVDEIIFSRRPATPGTLASVLDQARSTGIDIRLIPSFSETLKNRAEVQYLGDLPTIAIHQRKQRAVSLLVKRAIDIIFASIGIVVILPVCLVIAIAIKLQSPGTVFYRSKRVGYKGNVFICYKFRTMMENADSMHSQIAHLNERLEILFKIANDPRVTGVGAFLRKYSLDELPQLWNVLSGDMSLVGPRPSISPEVAQYKTPHLRRLDVVPGMTGLWQIEARNDPSFENYISLDSKYVSDWSILLDLKIILRTVNVILKGTGT